MSASEDGHQTQGKLGVDRGLCRAGKIEQLSAGVDIWRIFQNLVKRRIRESDLKLVQWDLSSDPGTLYSFIAGGGEIA